MRLVDKTGVLPEVHVIERENASIALTNTHAIIQRLDSSKKFRVVPALHRWDILRGPRLPGDPDIDDLQFAKEVHRSVVTIVEDVYQESIGEDPFNALMVAREEINGLVIGGYLREVMPTYDHDCEHCIFMGNDHDDGGGVMDYYYCPEQDTLTVRGAMGAGAVYTSMALPASVLQVGGFNARGRYGDMGASCFAELFKRVHGFGVLWGWKPRLINAFDTGGGTLAEDIAEGIDGIREMHEGSDGPV